MCARLAFFGVASLLHCAKYHDDANLLLQEFSFESILGEGPQGSWRWTCLDDNGPLQDTVRDSTVGYIPITEATDTHEDNFFTPLASTSVMKGGEKPESHGVQGREKTKLIASARANKLMERLKKESLGFEDVKNDYYTPFGRHDFQLDILKLMYNNIDIRETEQPDHYRCFGELQDVSTPSEEVSIAMFRLLSKKRRTLFELCFQLYRLGYRKFKLHSFGILEGALSVGGVHPYSRDIVSYTDDGVNISEQCQEIWEDVKDLTDQGIQDYLRFPPEKYAHTLQKTRYGRIIMCLKDLRDSGDLKILQGMQRSVVMVPPDGNGRKPKTSRKAQILTIWRMHKKKDLALEDLFKMVTLSQKSAHVKVFASRIEFLKVILTLAVQTSMILYDKAQQKVRLLEKKMPLEQPKKNTNLLIMMYDIMAQYDGHIILEEFAYYAYRQGYWSEFRGKGKERFQAYVEQYKESLAVQGYIGAQVFGKNRKEDIVCQNRIWTRIAQEGVVQDLAYYRDLYVDVIQKDLEVVRAVKASQQTPAFALFYDYVKGLEKARNADAVRCGACIEEALRQHSMTAKEFADYCCSLGLTTERDLWGISERLTNRKNGGRLLYHPGKNTFSWDSDGVLPTLAKVDRLSTIFSVKYDFPEISNQTLLYMVKQSGCLDITEVDVHEVLCGLSVLGLYPPYEPALTQERAIVDLLLTPDAAPEPAVNDHGRMLWPWKVAKIVVGWESDGSLRKLWQYYADVRDCAVKRIKLHITAPGTDRILREQTPKLYNILQEYITKEVSP